MQRILREHLTEVEVLGLDDVAPYDEPVEDQPTFEGNALLKARAGVAASGLPTLADDSGLCVDALNGMPGVLSARWSGPPKSMTAATTSCCSRSWPTCPTSVVRPTSPAPSRSSCPTARYGSSRAGWTAGSSARCGGAAASATTWSSRPTTSPGVTTAELTPADKDAISHRGKALREIAPVVADLLR